MPDQITQKLGFDASSAISSTAALNKSLSAMSTRFGEIATKAQKFNGTGDQIKYMLDRLKPASLDASKALGELSLRAAAASASFARLAVSLKNATGTAQAFNSTALGALIAKLDSASKAASRTVGGLNNIGVAASRAATGINKVGTGNLDALAKKTNDAAIAWRNLNWATRGAINNPKLNTPPQPKAPGNRGSGGSRNSKSLVVSPETIGRVLQTQALLRTLGAIGEAFHYAAESAIEFNAKVAEIRTISTVKDLGALKNQVASLAAEFNRPLTDVTEGYYQTLSNQVGDAVESTKFLSTALKFGKVAVTETGDSVNLLAGAIHAFNRPVEEAGDIAAKFFKTIELGRIRGSELANVYGRVATVAHQLGVSTSELDAAFVTMTNKGVRASEAATQISGAMTALIKPSKDGAAAIRSLGFDSGEALIEAYGFQGALQKLVETTDGSTTAISKLVPRVRGLSFVLAATGESAGFFKQSLTQIKSATEEGLNTEFLRQMSTDAEKVTQEINKLRIFLTKDFGDALLGIAGGALKATGGAETLSLALTHLLPLLGLAATAAGTAGAYYVATTLKTIAFAESTTLLGTAFKGTFGVLGAVLIAYEAYTFYQDKAQKAFERQVQAQIDGEERRLAAVRKATAQIIREREEETARTDALVAQRTARLTQAYNEEIDAAKTAGDLLVSQSKDLYSKLLQSVDGYLGQLRHKLDEKKRLEETLLEKRDEIRRKKDNDDFELAQRGKPDVEKAANYGKRAEQLAEEAKQLRSNPGATQADLAAADRKDREAEGYLGQLKGLSHREDAAAGRDDHQADQALKRARKGAQGLLDFDAQQALRGQERQADQQRRQANAIQRRQVQQWNAQYGALRRRNPRIKLVAGQFVGGDADARAQLELMRRQIKQRGVGENIAAAQDAAAKAKQAHLDANQIDALARGFDNSVRGKQAAGVDNQIANNRKQQEALEAGAKKALENRKQLQDLVKEYRENISLTDKKGNLLSADEQAERVKKSHAAATKILELTVDFKDDPELAKMVDGLQAEISKRLTDEEIQHIRVLPQAILDVHAQFQKVFDDKPLKMKAVVDFAAQSGRTIIDANGHIDPVELREGTKETSERQANLQRGRDEAKDQEADIASASNTGIDLLNQQQAVPRSYGSYLWNFATNQGGPRKENLELAKQQAKLYDDTRAGIADLLKRRPKDLSKEQVEYYRAQVKSLADTNKFGTSAAGYENNPNYKLMEQAVDQLEKLQSALAKKNDNPYLKPGGPEELKRIEGAEAGKQAYVQQEVKDLAEKEQQAWKTLAGTQQQAKQTWDEHNSLRDRLEPQIQQYNKELDEYWKGPRTKEQDDAFAKRLENLRPEIARRDELYKKGQQFDRQIEVEKRQAEQAQRQAKAATEKPETQTARKAAASARAAKAAEQLQQARQRIVDLQRERKNSLAEYTSIGQQGDRGKEGIDRRNALKQRVRQIDQEIEVQKRSATEAERAQRAAAAEAAALTQSLNPAAKLAQFAQWTANGFERGAKAPNKIKLIAAPDALKDPNDNIAAHGGTIRRFASGGGVGTDTIPALLTPGEVVWNAATSRRWYSQLTAINAGSRAPTAYPAANITNVGDINVTVPGGPSNAATARALADMTRRELRRRA